MFIVDCCVSVMGVCLFVYWCVSLMGVCLFVC